MEESTKDYSIEQVGEEATFLHDNGKVKEVFALAASGAIAVIEELGGKQYIVLKREKFDNIMEQFAEQNEVKLEITEASGE